MVERAASDADIQEQEQPATPEAPVQRVPHRADVSDADAFEQGQPTGPEPAVPRVSRAADVPEADAWEQALEVVEDDERV